MDKLSYALGLSMGQNFKGSGVDKLNADDFADALRAVYGEGTPAMTYDEAKQVVQEYFTNLQAKAGEMNAKAGKEYLANNAKEEGVKVTESGLQYLVVKEGNGKKPGPNDVVTVHYFNPTRNHLTHSVGQFCGARRACHLRCGSGDSWLG